MSNSSGNNLAVRLNLGDGTFTGAVNYPVGADPRGLAVGDINGDARPDLAVANQNGNSVSVLINKGQGAFRPAIEFDAGAAAFAVAIGDLDGNGAADLAVANRDQRDVSVMLAPAPIVIPIGDNDAMGTLLNDDNYTPPALSVRSVRRADSSPTSASSVRWRITFSEKVRGVDEADFVASGSVAARAPDGAPVAANASIISVRPDIICSGPFCPALPESETWVVTANLDPPPISGSLQLHVQDDDSIVAVDDSQPLGGSGAGNGDFAGETYTFDGAGPAVAVNQAAGQPDPTTDSPIHFTAVFSEPVGDFTADDVTLGGPGGISATEVTVTHLSPSDSYAIAVSGMTAGGPVFVSIAAGAAHDTVGNPNLASTSTDNSVNYAVPDAEPEAFGFFALSGVGLSSVSLSTTVTITGINVESPVSISGGQFRVYANSAWGPWAGSGTIANNQRVQVRHVNSAAPATATHTDLTVGGVTGRFSSTTGAEDTAPNPFSFPGLSGARVATVLVSTPVTISGIDAPAAVSVSGGEFRIYANAAWGPWTTSGSITNRERVQLRHTSAASPSTETRTELTVGGISGAFASTTEPPDTSPDGFAFATRTGVAPSTRINSGAVIIRGINTSTPVSVSDGQFRIYSGGAWGAWTASGSIVDNQRLQVRHTSAATPATDTSTDLTVGDVTARFTSTSAP